MDPNPSKLKKAKFIAARIKGKNKTQAAIAAGYKPGANASTAGCILDKDVEVQKSYASWAEKNGIGLDFIAKNYKQGVEESTADGKRIEWMRDIAKWNGLVTNEENTSPQTQVLVINATEAGMQAIGLCQTK